MVRGRRGGGAAAVVLVVILLSGSSCEADEAVPRDDATTSPPVWSADEFAPCPGGCGQPSSTQERTVRCAEQDGTQHPEQLCDLETKPETRRVCPATEACRVYVWKAQPFSDCPAGCGHAPVLQRRGVSCVYFDQQGLEVPANEDPLCELAAQPPSTRACPATAACTSHGWQTEPFQPCSDQCGRAAVLQTRVVECQTSDGTVVDDELCEHVLRPAESVQCPATTACAAHEWRAPTFLPCDHECGRSSYTRTRQVHCVELEPGDTLAQARVVEDANCARTLRPSRTRECPATDACLSYTWQAESFPDCPQECGSAALVQFREVVCTTEGRAVNATRCESGSEPPPNSVRTCAASAPCIDYSWEATEEFDACPEDCGLDATVQSREVVCLAMAGTAEAEVVENAECDIAEKPESERTCEATEACIVWQWTAEDWSLCPAECGQEPTLQQRAVTCEGSDGTVFAAGTAEAESHCSGANPPPPARRACPGTTSCVTYDWVVENPGTAFPPLCPTDCGLNASMATREVYCSGSDGSVVDDGNCTSNEVNGGSEKPLSQHACPATEACITFSWLVDPPTFPACKTTCGQAEVVSTRLVTCAGSDGSVGPPSECEGDPPESRHVCSRTPDCVRFAWSAEPVDFPACPATCGHNASVQHRTVSCRGSDGSLLSGTAAMDRCDEEKPAEARACPATSPCVTYSWLVQNFPPCPTECGQEAILQSRAVLCVGSDGSETVGDTAAMRCLQAGVAPPAQHACMPTEACVHWRWRAEPSAFPLCPTMCGQNTSVQTRRVVCEGTDGTLFHTDDPLQRELAEAPDRCGDAAVPSTRNVCPGTQQCMAFHWAAAPFPEPCPDPGLCGQRERVTTRVVECRGDDGNTYEDARCLATGASALPLQQICPETAACVVYTWVATPAEFLSCPTVCGMDESTQTRTVECHGSDDSVVTGRDAGFSCTLPAPASHKHCEATAKCGHQVVQDERPYSWQAADFPPCGTTCGLPAVIQRRQVVCIDSARAEEVDSEQCEELGRQPAALRACAGTEPCQVTPAAPPPPPPASLMPPTPTVPPPPPQPTIPEHNPAPTPPPPSSPGPPHSTMPPSEPQPQPQPQPQPKTSAHNPEDTVRDDSGAPFTPWFIALCLVFVMTQCIVCAACTMQDDEAAEGSTRPFKHLRSITSSGQLAGLSPTKRKTTWLDLPRSSFGVQAARDAGYPGASERPRRRSQSRSPQRPSGPPNVSEPCICMVGRESIEVEARLSTNGLANSGDISPTRVVSRWTTPALPAVRRLSRSPPRQGTLSGETRRSPSRTLRLDDTMVSPRSPTRPARRLAEVEYFNETSDSDLDTDEESQRLRAQPDGRWTGGAAGGRWDRPNAQSALAKVVEQNQPAYLYSL